jgi:hypothetical protein
MNTIKGIDKLYNNNLFKVIQSFGLVYKSSKIRQKRQEIKDMEKIKSTKHLFLIHFGRQPVLHRQAGGGEVTMKF